LKNLNFAFKPKRVAVIGASPDPKKIGHQVIKISLMVDMKGKLSPSIQLRVSVLGRKAYKSLNDIPEGVDLAIIAIPAHLVSQPWKNVPGVRWGPWPLSLQVWRSG